MLVVAKKDLAGLIQGKRGMEGGKNEEKGRERERERGEDAGREGGRGSAGSERQLATSMIAGCGGMPHRANQLAHHVFLLITSDVHGLNVNILYRSRPVRLMGVGFVGVKEKICGEIFDAC